MALIKKRAYIETHTAVAFTTDGLPRTGLSVDGYNQLTNTVKGYFRSEDVEGNETYNEVIEIQNDNVKSLQEY